MKLFSLYTHANIAFLLSATSVLASLDSRNPNAVILETLQRRQSAVNCLTDAINNCLNDKNNDKCVSTICGQTCLTDIPELSQCCQGTPTLDSLVVCVPPIAGTWYSSMYPSGTAAAGAATMTSAATTTGGTAGATAQGTTGTASAPAHTGGVERTMGGNSGLYGIAAACMLPAVFLL